MILSDIERLSKILNDTEHRAASLRQLSFLFVIVLRLAFTVAAIWFISPLWEPPNCVSLAKTNSMYYTFFRIYDLFSIMWFFVSHALFKYLSCFVYTGWLIKTSQICNDVVLLNNRIQTKANNFFKEQSQLNSVRNYDVVCFYFDSEIHKRVLGVRNVQNNQKVQHVSLHEIDIQSQRLAENVLNRAFILLIVTALSRFLIVQWIFELSQWWPPSICFYLPLWGPVDLQTKVVGLCTPNPAWYPKCSTLKDYWRILENMMPIHQQLWNLRHFCEEFKVISLIKSTTFRQ